MNKPKIICLLGSTRFTHDMLIRAWELTKQGFIVIHWAVLPDDYFQGNDKSHIADQEGVKIVIDELYRRKIDLSDECEVINIGGYIGESTRSEIEYATQHGKPVKYLYQEHQVTTVDENAVKKIVTDKIIAFSEPKKKKKKVNPDIV